MIFSLRGKAILVRPFFVVIECAGVGYGVRVPLETSQFLANHQGEVLLHTRTIVREHTQELYGFLNLAEAELFDFLRELPGLGPAMSLNLISAIGSEQLIQALLKGDTLNLQKVPQVGKARANKIIFEVHLKEKKLKAIAEQIASSLGKKEKKEKKESVRDDIKEKLYEALYSLGFQTKEIEKAERQIAKEFSQKVELSEANLAEWIRIYLRYL